MSYSYILVKNGHDSKADSQFYLIPYKYLPFGQAKGLYYVFGFCQDMRGDFLGQTHLIETEP
jgi:hypothetical protein